MSKVERVLEWDGITPTPDHILLARAICAVTRHQKPPMIPPCSHCLHYAEVILAKIHAGPAPCYANSQPMAPAQPSQKVHLCDYCGGDITLPAKPTRADRMSGYCHECDNGGYVYTRSGQAQLCYCKGGPA